MVPPQGPRHRWRNHLVSTCGIEHGLVGGPRSSPAQPGQRLTIPDAIAARFLTSGIVSELRHGAIEGAAVRSNTETVQSEAGGTIGPLLLQARFVCS